MNIDNLDGLDVDLPPEFWRLPVFVVGGAVRDAILDREVSDIDLMVAEVSPDEMLDRGFREIDSPNNETFGVFHDSLGREVAIAREEESTGDAHTDFDVRPVPADVPASEAVQRDLKRRDFTINAMAFDARHEVLHDPHGGRGALDDGVVRHVSDSSFQEDPLRILRGARFAARLGFRVAIDTKTAMRAAGDGISNLPQERVRMEMEKALVESEKPSRFFEILGDVEVLGIALPEIASLRGVPAGPPAFHGEGSAFSHTMMVLDEMSDIRPNDEIALLMALGHDLGKTVTPSDELPNHPKHGQRGIDVIESVADRLSMSSEQERAMKQASRFHMRLHDVSNLRESTVIETLLEVNDLDRMFDLMRADSRGREPSREWNRGVATLRFARAEIACNEVTGQDLIDDGFDPDEMGGEQFGDLLLQRRVERMREL